MLAQQVHTSVGFSCCGFMRDSMQGNLDVACFVCNVTLHSDPASCQKLWQGQEATQTAEQRAPGACHGSLQPCRGSK